MTTQLDTVIVGGGFSGLCMANRLKSAGFTSFAVLEKADAVGGVWRENTYPGCACDIPSALYSLSCAADWSWARRYGAQPEVLRYLHEYVLRKDLTAHLRLKCEVTQARWDEVGCVWEIKTRDADVLRARTLILAMGGLHLPSIPDIPGQDEFEGYAFHSARWNDGVSLQGKRVAVVGSGASAVQIVPSIASEVAQLEVYQRTPAWILPREDRQLSDTERGRLQRWPALRTFQRFKDYAMREALTRVLKKPGLGTATLQRVARAHLHSQIPDPALRAALTPSYAIGCKRILLSSDYYPVFRRDNVSLVTAPISAVSPTGIITQDGREHSADVIVWATGFKPNGFPETIAIEGVGGRSLHRTWSESPGTYLGICTAGYPNLFVMSGPNTGLGHNSVLLMIEAQAEHILRAHQFMRRTSCRRLEVRDSVQAQYFSEIQRRLAASVWQAGGCSSWYQRHDGLNVAVWPGVSGEYARRARRFSARAYTVSLAPAAS